MTPDEIVPGVPSQRCRCGECRGRCRTYTMGDICGFCWKGHHQVKAKYPIAAIERQVAARG